MTNRVYDYTLAAAINATARLPVPGTFVLVISAPQGPVGIKLDGGAEVVCQEGQGISLPDGASFSEVAIRNQQAVAFTGTVFIGNASFIDRRITGTVSVVDGGRARTLASLAVMRYLSYTGGGATAPLVGVRNVAASGKRIVVKSVIVTSSVAGLVEVGPMWYAPNGIPAAFVSKLTINGAFVPVSTAIMQMERGDLGIGNVTPFFGLQLAANVPFQFTFQEPVVLQQGAAMAAWINVNASTITAAYECTIENDV